MVIAIVLLANLSFGLTRLGEYSSVDEPYWTYGRITKFWNGVKAHNWKTTSVNDKPGITVAILSGAGLAKIDPMPYEDLRGDPKTEGELQIINDINFFFRLPIFLFSVLLLPLFYVLTRKLFNEMTALISFVFIGLSPILLGISLIINPDSLLWLFLPLSLLSYFVFQKEGTRKYLLLSGVLLGLALLTKYVSNILYVFFFFLPFLEYLFAKEKPELKTYLKKSLQDYGILALVSMTVFFVLYPATWVNPKLLLEGTFLSAAFKSTWPLFVGTIALVTVDVFLFRNRATAFILDVLTRWKGAVMRAVSAVFLAGIAFVLVNTYGGMRIFDTEGSLASPKGEGTGPLLPLYADKITADIYSLIFAVSPLVLIGLLLALVLVFRKEWIKRRETKIILILSLFILFYYLASTVNHVVATVRYQIALYPLAFIMAAIGISSVLSSEKIRRYVPSSAAYAILIAVSLASLISIKPFYFAYTSALLPQAYFVNLKDMGDGSYEAAAYLNGLPDAEKLTIWSDKGAVCAVFKGNCVIGFTNKRIKGVQFDYVVVSSGRESRSLKLSGGANGTIDFQQAYDAGQHAVYTVVIGNRPNNFVKVIDAKEIAK
jgi:4-amino-4-deoxy-L-arabinose transferase-like glycosyltransferase